MGFGVLPVLSHLPISNSDDLQFFERVAISTLFILHISISCDLPLIALPTLWVVEQ